MSETFQRILCKTSHERNSEIICTVFKKRDIVCVLKYNKHILYIFLKVPCYSNYNTFHNTTVFERLKKKQYTRKFAEKGWQNH